MGTKGLGSVLRSWDHPCPCGTLSELGQPSIAFTGKRREHSGSAPLQQALRCRHKALCWELGLAPLQVR